MDYIIGIDLGTTNCTLAYAPLSDKNPTIDQLPISQRLERDLEGEKPFLPSFYFCPLAEEKFPPCVGWYAKKRGAELPDRVISSAKSWLCYDAVDRRSPFLPLGDYQEKKSPVEISAAFLSHLRETWEKRVPQHAFNEQQVLVTVPASFDPSARQLVQEAALAAGFPEIILMEEPLAAFYAWLHAHEHDWRDRLKVGDTILVVDVGGGTTDFSLIGVSEQNGSLSLERQAVGNHLLLGGDNIDLALAHLAAEKCPDELDEWQFQSLVHACREAKEKLLGEELVARYEVIIPGRGSRLIGGSLSLELTRDETIHTLLEGFFPFVPFEEKALEEKRSGLANLGLPYVRDPRITAQLATFLSQYPSSFPTFVLFNGGTMKSHVFQGRIIDQLSKWKGETVFPLSGADLDYGVSRGAAYYGWVRQGKGIRVRAGTSRSYFIGVESSLPAVPGMEPPIKAVCLAPFGMEEGTEVTLEGEAFSLLLEEEAVFRFFCSPTSHLSTGEIPRVGTTLRKWKNELIELHPIATLLQAQGEHVKHVIVKLTAKVTELGVLELWCVAENGHKWKLEFDIRKN